MLLSNEMFFSGIVREQSVKQVYFTSVVRAVISGKALKTEFLEYSHSYCLIMFWYMPEAVAQNERGSRCFK